MNGRTRFDLSIVRRLAGAGVRNLCHRAMRSGEQGMALVFALLGLVVLTILGLGLTGIGMSGLKVTTNEAENNEALAIADAGISHAKRLLLWQDWKSFNQFLQRGDGTGCTKDEFAGQPINGTGGYPVVPAGFPSASSATDFIPQAGRPFGVGNYVVKLCDDNSTDLDPDTGVVNSDPASDVNKRVLLRSTGTGRNGSSATIEVVIGALNIPAIFVNGNVNVSGNPEVSGADGVIYSNGDMLISGNPCAQQYFMSTGGTTSSGGGNAQGGTTCTATDADLRSNSQPLNVATLTPTDFVQYADFKLDQNGIVYTRLTPTSPWTAVINASVPANAAAVAALIGSSWNYQQGASQKDWKINTGNSGTSASKITPATYYIQGTNLTIGASPGTVADPVECTLIVDGWVNVSGSPVMKPHLTLDWFGGIAIVAGTDIEMSGSTSGNFKGLFYAHDQIAISGTPTLVGQIVAANLADVPYPATGAASYNLVPYNGAMQISGTANITFSSGGMVGVSQLSWRECRGSTADPCGTP